MFLSVLFRQTKVCRLAADSIFVPSMYCTSRLTCPAATSFITTWTNRLLTASFRRSLRKRLIVLNDGVCPPLSHM